MFNHQNNRKNISVLGTTLGRRGGRIFGIQQADRLLHTFIIGQTGTGKSTLLASLCRQDIEAGRGFCLIDPHGDVAEALGADGRRGEDEGLGAGEPRFVRPMRFCARRPRIFPRRSSTAH